MQDETIIRNESGSSFLDLLAVAAENLKLLTLGPFLAGLVVLGVSFVVPQTYISEAILVLPTVAANGATMPIAAPSTQAAAMMVSPLVLDSVVQILKLSDGKSIESVRKKLRNQVKTVVGKDGLLRLETSAESPKEAQLLASVILETWLKSTIPGSDERAELEVRLAHANSSLENVERILKRLTSEGSVDLNKPLTRGEVGASILAAAELQTRYLNDSLSLKRTLNGYSRDVVKQVPTLPAEAASPKKGLISTLIAICTCLILVVWVFARHAWRKSSCDTLIKEKQGRLLVAIGLKSNRVRDYT